jgi:hypothetical protein
MSLTLYPSPVCSSDLLDGSFAAVKFFIRRIRVLPFHSFCRKERSDDAQFSFGRDVDPDEMSLALYLSRVRSSDLSGVTWGWRSAAWTEPRHMLQVKL